MPTILDGITTNETWGAKAVATYADPAAPKLATEYNAATSVVLECLLVERTKPSAKVEKTTLRRACSSKGRERAGVETRQLAPLRGVYNPQDLAAPVSKAYVALAKGTVWYLTLRNGIHIDTALEAADKVTIYKVSVDYRIEVEAADNDEFQWEAGLSVLDWWENVTMAA